VLKPLSGEIFFEGQRVSSLRPYQRVPLGISLVPEGRELFYWMGVEETS